MHLYLSALAIGCYMTLLVFAVRNPDCWVRFVISMFVSPQDKLASFFFTCMVILPSHCYAITLSTYSIVRLFFLSISSIKFNGWSVLFKFTPNSRVI